MLFSYKALDKTNVTREGTVEASNIDAAIVTVQKRGYTVVSIDPIEEKHNPFNLEITWFQHVTNKELVILSRQIATLFEAQVSPLRVFRLLGTEAENQQLRTILNEVADDLQAGSSLSRALGAHPAVFTPFYINMVRAGEESGSLERSFTYLAEYLDRMYQVITKARNALVYPAFVVGVFFLVMGLMLTLVIPRISKILTESGQDLPIYTKIVLAISNFFSNYIGIVLALLTLSAIGLWRFARTDVGRRAVDEFKISIPYIGDLYRKLYLTRICDNLSTMLSSGIPLIQAIEVTAEIVDNRVFREILDNALREVKGGRSFADVLSEYPEIPSVLAQMVKVGEETGNTSEILVTLAKFYNREVNNAVDTLIGLIEPLMIVILGLGVGTLLASVLMPIYNLTSSI